MNMQSGQDWNPVVLKKKTATGGAAKSKDVVNDALRKGGSVETVKKFSAGSNKTEAGKDAAKLDRETEELHHDRVPLELKKKIQQARLDKKMTQAQLGNLINEKPSVITDYESGKAIPSPQILSKLSRALGVQLSAKKK